MTEEELMKKVFEKWPEDTDTHIGRIRCRTLPKDGQYSSAFFSEELAEELQIEVEGDPRLFESKCIMCLCNLKIPQRLRHFGRWCKERSINDN